MSEKSVFMSDGWIAGLEEVAQKLLDQSGVGADRSFSYVEQFSAAPEPRGDDRESGYVLTLEMGKASVRSGVVFGEAADCTVCMDYEAALESLALRSGPEHRNFMRSVAEAGKITMTGSLEGFPISLEALHDAICDRTA